MLTTISIVSLNQGRFQTNPAPPEHRQSASARNRAGAGLASLWAHALARFAIIKEMRAVRRWPGQTTGNSSA